MYTPFVFRVRPPNISKPHVMKYQQQRGLINKFKHAVIENSIIYLTICIFISTCVVVVVWLMPLIHRKSCLREGLK
jgi:hypothetical protein